MAMQFPNKYGSHIRERTMAIDTFPCVPLILNPRRHPFKRSATCDLCSFCNLECLECSFYEAY